MIESTTSTHHAALARATRALNRDLDLRAGLAAICEEACRWLEADFGAIYLEAPPGDRLVVAAAHGLPPEAIGDRLEPGSGLAGRVAVSDRALATNDYGALAGEAPSPECAEIQSCAALPMRWDGALRGVLALGCRRRSGLGDDTLAALEPFAELAAAACRHAMDQLALAEAARTDALTGCLNHPALHEALDREIARSARGGHPLSLILLDLDGFKQVNDRHGHLAGDDVLRAVGARLREEARRGDLVARYGGDEFAVLAPDSDEDAAAALARRMLDRLAAEAGGPAVAATAGVAQWTFPRSATELVAAADGALLAGKRSGVAGAVVRAARLPAPVVAPGGREKRRRKASSPPAVTVWPDPAEETERLRKRSRQLALANELGARLAGMTDAHQILETGVDALHRAFGYFLCAAIRIDPRGHVYAAAVRGDAFRRLDEQRWRQPLEEGVIGRCLRERAPMLVNDVSADPDYNATGETGAVGAELCVPLWVGDELWGAVNVEELETGAFDDDDARLLETTADQIGAALLSARLYERLDRAYLGTAQALAAALEARDSYTASHSRAIARHATAVGRRLGMDARALRELEYAAVLHDIGKIAIPDELLHKADPLTASERAIVERHPVIGERILAPIDFLAGVRPLIRHAHERWDGGGYPDRLAGEAIPLGARIVFACDAYDAMRSDRSYRSSLPAAEARAALRAGAGAQFDPRVVEALLAVLDAAAEPAAS